jgi:hypothetical protein
MGAYVLGFALYQPTQANGNPLIQPIGLDQSPGDRFSVAYNPTTASTQLPLIPGEVDLVAAPCLAADIPAPNPPTDRWPGRLALLLPARTAEAGCR